MNIELLTEIDYSDFDCDYEKTAVCPYCGYENEILAEDYGGQDEEQPDYCGNCERHFMRTTDYDIRFSTEPIENYIIRENSRMKRNIDGYEKRLLSAEENDKSYYQQMVDFLKSELSSFKKEYESYIE
jgi:hypothetical protein